MKHPCWSAQQVNIKQSYEISHKQRATLPTVARTSPPPNKKYSTPWNIKVRSVPTALMPGQPVPAWWSAAWLVVRRAALGRTLQPGDDPRMRANRMVGRNGTTISGLHGGIHSPPPLPHTQSWYNNAVHSATGELASCEARRMQNVHSTGGRLVDQVEWHNRRESERVLACALWLPPFPQFASHFCPRPPTPRVRVITASTLLSICRLPC